MPKERRGRSVSLDRSKATPYHCSSSYPLISLPENHLEEVKEWEEARCPVCMEHPHNAVLLLCSSREKGCRPYMCDTSYRHSNCLDQFRKSTVTEGIEDPPTLIVEPSTPVLSSEASTEMDLFEENVMEDDVHQPMTPSTPILVSCEGDVHLNISCPLCRGRVDGWIVVDKARSFMNTKARSCACETCEYSGTYADLRKHARSEHPLVRPTEIDPERQSAWRSLERERDLGDVLSTMRSVFRGGRARADSETGSEGTRIAVFILFRVFRTSPPESDGTGDGARFPRFRAVSGMPSRFRTSAVRSETSATRSGRQRRSQGHWGETYDSDIPSNAVARDEEDNDSSDGPERQQHTNNNERSRL